MKDSFYQGKENYKVKNSPDLFLKQIDTKIDTAITDLARAKSELIMEVNKGDSYSYTQNAEKIAVAQARLKDLQEIKQTFLLWVNN